MLTLSPLHTITYYSELCHEDYYTDSAEPLGIWGDELPFDQDEDKEDKEMHDADPKPN